MIEVRIRHANAHHAGHLGEVPLTDSELNEVISIVESLGPQSDGPTNIALAGRFVLRQMQRLFRVIGCNDDE